VWRGKAVDDLYASLPGNLEPLGTPQLVVLDVGPGVEVNAGPALLLFARGTAVIPLAGSSVQELQAGPAALITRGAPVADAGLGFQVCAGVRVQLPSLFATRDELILYD
jgi:hypothetical protein